jgi:hypothetical protein
LGVLSLILSNEKAKHEGKIEFGPRFEGVVNARKKAEGSETKVRLRVAQPRSSWGTIISSIIAIELGILERNRITTQYSEH